MRKDVRDIGSFYEEAILERGVTPFGVGHPSEADSAARFEALLERIDLATYSSKKPLKLLDFGCGPGFLLDYLAKNGLLDRIDYLGIDVTEVTLKHARARWPGYHFDLRDIRDQPFGGDAFDFCVACGVFTARYGNGKAETRYLAEQSLRAIWPSVRLGLSFNTMSKHVDRERDDLFHWPLDDIMAFCKAQLSRHVSIRLDLGPWETSVSVLKSPIRRRSQVPPTWFSSGLVGSDRSGVQRVQGALAANRPLDSVTGCVTFDYASGRPNLYLLMRFKQALVAALGVRAGFAVFRQTLSIPDCSVLEEVPLQGERAFAQTRARVFHEISPAGQRFILEPPPVIGEGNHASRESVMRSFYVTCLVDARIRGRSALIEVGGVALLDYQADERRRLDDEIEWDPTIFSPKEGERDSVWVLRPEFDSCSIEVEEAFTLLGVHTDFFGDWMIEYLPKYVAARLSGHLPSVPVLIDADMPEQHRQSLELLFPGEIDLIEVPAFTSLRVRKLWCAPCLFYMPLHEKRNERFGFDIVAAPPQRFAPVIEDMARRADLTLGKFVASRKIYLARRDFRHRRLVNRAAIEALATAHGFEVVFPEDMSFAKQVALVRSASHIVAPEGSAIFLVLFAAAGAKLCILSHPLTDPLNDYHGLFSTRNVSTVALTGPIVSRHSQTPHDSDYRIDEGQFGAFLSRWPEDRGLE